jgi:predicted nucleotidyltransferase
MIKIFSAKRKKIENYCKENGISYLGLFGSYARGDFKKDSDIDLLVRVKRNVTLLDLVRMERELAKILGKKVDLLTKASLSKYIRERVIKEAKPIYEGR